MTKLLCLNDAAADTETFRQAKLSEVRGLQSRNTWTVVDRRELAKDAKILGGRFVLTLKDISTQKETPKARYVLHGHKAKEKRVPCLYCHTPSPVFDQGHCVLGLCQGLQNFQ